MHPRRRGSPPLTTFFQVTNKGLAEKKKYSREMKIDAAYNNNILGMKHKAFEKWLVSQKHLQKIC